MFSWQCIIFYYILAFQKPSEDSCSTPDFIYTLKIFIYLNTFFFSINGVSFFIPQPKRPLQEKKITVSKFHSSSLVYLKFPGAHQFRPSHIYFISWLHPVRSLHTTRELKLEVKLSYFAKVNSRSTIIGPAYVAIIRPLSRINHCWVTGLKDEVLLRTLINPPSPYLLNVPDFAQ